MVRFPLRRYEKPAFATGMNKTARKRLWRQYSTGSEAGVKREQKARQSPVFPRQAERPEVEACRRAHDRENETEREQVPERADLIPRRARKNDGFRRQIVGGCAGRNPAGYVRRPRHGCTL